MVLSALTEDLQRDVAERIAKMDRTSPDVIEHVEAILERKLSTVIQQADFSSVGGIQSLVDILNNADRTTERLILEGLEQKDPQTADDVRSRMFVFEDVTTLDDRSVQLVLRSVDAKDLAIALKGVDQKVRDKILKNMSERAAGEPRRGDHAARPGEAQDGRRVAGRRGTGDPFARGIRTDRHVPWQRRIRHMIKHENL